VDEALLRPRSVLNPFTPLTCDDVRRPQFPQALLLRRIHFIRRPVLIEAGDERTERQDQRGPWERLR